MLAGFRDKFEGLQQTEKLNTIFNTGYQSSINLLQQDLSKVTLKEFFEKLFDNFNSNHKYLIVQNLLNCAHAIKKHSISAYKWTLRIPLSELDYNKTDTLFWLSLFYQFLQPDSGWFPSICRTPLHPESPGYLNINVNFPDANLLSALIDCKSENPTVFLLHNDGMEQIDKFLAKMPLLLKNSLDSENLTLLEFVNQVANLNK